MRRRGFGAAAAANLLQVGLQRIIFLDHSAGHEAAFVLGDDDLIGSRIAYDVGVTLLAGAGNDFHVGIEGSGGDGDVEVIGIVIDHNADSQGALNARGLQDVVTFGVSLNDHEAVFQEFAVEAFVGFNEDEGNLDAAQLIDHSATDLAVAANDEVPFHFFEADFVHHGFPNLRAMPAEDCDRNPLRNPHLKGKNSDKDEQGKKLGGIVHAMVIDGVGVEDPEGGILPTQALQPHIHAHTQKAESRQEQDWQPQAANEDYKNASHWSSNAMLGARSNYL